MIEKRRPWGKWYWSDWRGDTRLRRCSFAARGLWADMLSVMGGESEHFGFLMAAGPLGASDLAGFFGSTKPKVSKLLDELDKNRVFSRTGDPELPADLRDVIPEGIPDGVIFSRRMVRDMAKEAREHGWGVRGGGNPELRRGTVPLEERARPYKRSDNPAKTRRIFEKDDGRCHWCSIELAYDGPAGHNFYHVDHLIPVANGGKSDEENLVAACAKCNHDRARVGWPFGRILRNYDPLLGTDQNVRQEPGKISDSKAQRLETRDQKKKEDAGPKGPAAIAASGSKDDQTWIFNEGLQWLAGESGRSEKALRSFIGKCLKTLKGDAGQLRLAIEEASRQPKLADATEWVAAAVKARGAAQGASVAAPRRFAPRQAQPSMAEALDAAQEQLARVFANTGMWPPGEGPKPGERGCRLPPEVLARYGLRPFQDAPVAV